MGHASYKGGASTYHSLSDNAQSLKDAYGIREGYFGTRSNNGNSRVRNIESDDPLDEAQRFYEKASYGGIEEQIEEGKWMASMKDGTILTIRITSSSDGSPAVDINIKKSVEETGIKGQKIHFVKKGAK